MLQSVDFTWIDTLWEYLVVLGPYILLAVDISLRLTALVVVPRNRRPGSAMAWLMAIMSFPIIGFPLFLLLGRAKLPRKRHEKQRTVNQLARSRAEKMPDAKIDRDQPSWLQSAVTLNRSLGAFPLTSGNRADLEIDYQASIEGIAADIDAAQDYAHILFYIMGLDEKTQPVFDAIARAVQRGVTVRVLYDYCCLLYTSDAADDIALV